MSLQNEINLLDINNILKTEERELNDFSTLLGNKELLKVGYEKLTGIENKPDFEIVWSKIISITEKIRKEQDILKKHSKDIKERISNATEKKDINKQIHDNKIEKER